MSHDNMLSRTIYPFQKCDLIVYPVCPTITDKITAIVLQLLSNHKTKSPEPIIESDDNHIFI